MIKGKDMKTENRIDLIRESHLRLRKQHQERRRQRELVKSLALDILRRFDTDRPALVH